MNILSKAIAGTLTCPLRSTAMLVSVTALFSATAIAGNDNPTETLQTRAGDFTFETDFLHGIPTQESSAKLFELMDYQRASQAYIWSVPLVSNYAWKQAYADMGAEDGQITYVESHESKLGGLTYNTSTPYAITWFNVEKEPVVIEIPTDELRGAVHTMWQIGISQMTEPGVYVVKAKGAETPSNLPKSAKVFESDTNYVFFGVRLMAESDKQRMKDLEALKITDLNGKPLSDNGINFPERGEDAKHPRGMAFWETLNEAIQSEPVAERDRMMHDMLRPLGIEKGKAFTPSVQQRDILEQAVVMGEAMVKNIDFNKTERLPHAAYGNEGNSWEIATASTPNQDRDYGMDLDGRAAWFYEAVTNDIAMHGFENGGWGQIYLDNYRDDNANGLNGSNHYTLTLDGDVNFADLFWTITVYNVENRAIIDNDIERADVGSNIEGTVKDAQGNYTFHFSPTKPAGVNEANWVQTREDENWFVYFRAYSPSKAFVAQQPETVLPNFKRVN
ncbi:DUF1214 domain-containing protein [Vibrio cyclitrophicus]|uniref:DUF1214 domain-containing protein n=1 Tax=Vibrio cyclitrophicus ZF270 TaxID=1136176 RepID=A0AAN0LQE0_9VIBR|nr:DUF1214 domain-containing protein [Vibrio cyclitrophicus]OBT29888.1 CDP-4-dehydro-6-deoxy-D-glucose 3-dehydratase [Vibrio cyclitrophicus]OEE20445.1 CDP-4-dehydro-6-deoxy-D-glucose 3-dehydratase [Vibrio cyclitrophicus ZF205]PMG10580.1 CDP-4-dehydro-6-deoxy-D-glucose 3-dehydratase [Vibrio cyclitrophicus]PMG46299.1 CDP-4-dehydro-6-deoxy-D-glucose 3-dehydratase [Vibrio cyclitrophicus]PMH22855.1 CDP-4-dehydro-6-deoxy-D-glucose 3-dehydratase [Vibrio cyclitrophicus]